LNECLVILSAEDVTACLF